MNHSVGEGKFQEIALGEDNNSPKDPKDICRERITVGFTVRPQS